MSEFTKPVIIVLSVLAIVGTPILACGGCFVFFVGSIKESQEAYERIEAAKSPEQKAEEAKEDKIASMKYVTKEFIKKQMKVPDSTKFDRTYGGCTIEGSFWTCYGNVSSKNAFGVTVNDAYEVTWKLGEDYKIEAMVCYSIGDESRTVNLLEKLNYDEQVGKSKSN